MSVHCTLGPSAAQKWMKCPASVAAEEWITSREGYEETVSVHAEIGTHAHALADECLSTGIDVFEAKVVPEESYELAEGVQRHVQNYLDYVRRTAVAIGGSIRSEMRVDYSRFMPPGEEGFGTLDACVLDAPGTTLHIFDLKFGVGVEVSAKSNPQMLMYALGASCIDGNEKVSTFHLHICQPRLRNWSSEKIAKDKLMEFGVIVGAAAKKCREKKAKFNPGEKQCRFCKALPSCRGFKDRAMQVLRKGVSPEEWDAGNPGWKISTEEKIEILKSRPSIRSYMVAVGNELQEHLRAGEEVPGFKLVARRKIRKWADATNAGEVLQKLIGYKAYKESVISPTEAQRLTTRSVVSALLGETTNTIEDAVIAPIEDRRKAIDRVEYFGKEEKNG